MLKLWYTIKSPVNIINYEHDFIKNIDKIDFEKNNYRLFPIYTHEIITREFIEIITDCGLQSERYVAIFACKSKTVGFLHKDITLHTKTGKYCEGSINCLVTPSRGQLEWFDRSNGVIKPTELDSTYEGWDNPMDAPIDKWDGYNGPALVNTSVAHRANNLSGMFPRVAVTIRFENNPNWETLISKLSAHLDLTRT